MDNSLYIQLVRSLLYLTHSQPNLEYDVGDFEIYMHEPHGIHWKDAKIIFHYVQGTKHFGVHYAASSPLELVVFSDSDWDGDPNERKSTSGYVFIFAQGTIFWLSSEKHAISI